MCRAKYAVGEQQRELLSNAERIAGSAQGGSETSCAIGEDTEFGLFRLFLDFILIGGEPNVTGVVAGRADKEPPSNTGFTLEHGVKAVAIAAGRAGPELVVKVCFYDFGVGLWVLTQDVYLTLDLIKPFAMDELHGVVADTVMLTHVVYRNDVRMVQVGGRSCLTAKALVCNSVLNEFPRENLQRNAAAKRGLFGLVHDSHPASTDLGQNPILANFVR